MAQKNKKSAIAERPLGLNLPWRQHPLTSLRDEVEDLMTRLTGEDGWFHGQIVPSLDLSETDTAVEVQMDLPGVDPEQVDIRVSGNTLYVQGELNKEKEEKNRRFHRIERTRGSFSRTITLPCPVMENEVAAEYKDGILTVTLPKSEEARSRRIQVKH